MFAEVLKTADFSQMTPGRQWRFKRNCVIYASWKNGFSQRLLSDVFALPRSRIADILKEFVQYDNETNE